MSGTKFMGHKMTREAAGVLRRAIAGLTYMEISEQTGASREQVKRWVQYWRTRGIDIPRTPRSPQREPREQRLQPGTSEMIRMAKAGHSAKEIAAAIGTTQAKVRNLLSYHRSKGEPIPLERLPLEQYKALHAQGYSQQRIAEALRIGKRKAAYCAKVLGLGRQERCEDKPVGRDLWAVALGRRELF